MTLNYKSLKDHVYLYLYERINNGTLKPGDKINENQLCKDLEVSRTPIREALIKLEDEGYIERLPRRGFVVKEISLGKIKEIYEILGCLEGFAASLAIDRLTEKDLMVMKILVQKMDDAISDKNVHEYFKLQRNFHETYILACGNKELFDLIILLKKRFVKKAYLLHENEETIVQTMKKNNLGHKNIVDLLEKKDKSGIEALERDVHWNLENVNVIVSPFESEKTKGN
jgi:DNA-binding GntR family transcriptional regulator